jgi:signal transduction histidine kinase
VYVLRDPRSVLTEEERAEIIDRIADRTARLQALVRKLLTASRIDTGAVQPRRQPVRVLELILERLAEFTPGSGDVHVSCDPSLVALVSREELSEMLGNYLENAFIHGRPPIEVRAAERAGWIDVEVYDSGPGVPAEFLPHLFERFSREPDAAQRTEGSGLGLWIVRNLARANGGEARYEPGNGGPACFCLHLQRATESV